MEENVLMVENEVEKEEIADGGTVALECGFSESPGEGEEDRLRAENIRLRGELACARVGIPSEIAGDIISIAAAQARDGDEERFEEAVREVYERICTAVCRRGARSKSGISGITTGAKVEKESAGANDALRRAFGLK